MRMHKCFLAAMVSTIVLAVLIAATPALAVQYVIEISVDGLGGTYLGKIFNGTATGGPYAIPNFTRLKNEGASTLYAHCDNNNWETLPNHTSIVTARPRDGVAGHNWSGNSDPAIGQTIHSNKGSYVAGVFDVAHDNGLRTGMYANKTKFSLFDNTPTYQGGGSYNATYGALDTNPVGGDNGRDKVDNTYINTSLSGAIANTYIAQQKTASPNHFAFLHFNNPDSVGHSSGWGSAAWNNSVVAVDTMLGNIFQLIEHDAPAMIGNTAIVLTADHGNQDNPPTGADRYQVPLFVWGPGVRPGADLYALNPGLRQPASSYPMTTYSGVQPFRNAEASNLALDLLGLGPIPGSMFNYAQNVTVPEPSTVALLAAAAIAAGAMALRRRKPFCPRNATNARSYATTTIKMCCVGLLVGAVTAGTAQADYLWQAFNDCSPSGSGTCTDTNYVSIYTLSNNTRAVNGITPTSTGPLKNFATGLPLVPTVTFTHVNADCNGTLGSGVFAAGTPANNVFVAGTSNKINVNQGGTSMRKNPTGATTPWYVEMTFANLNPGLTYTLATTLNRDNLYATIRWTKVSISGAEDFVNESAAGNPPSPSSIPQYFYNPGSGSDYVSIGPKNTTYGALAEWTHIKPGADGQFVIRFAVPGSTTETGGYAADYTEGGYGPTAFMLAAEVPEPATWCLLLVALAGVLAIRRFR